MREIGIVLGVCAVVGAIIAGVFAFVPNSEPKGQTGPEGPHNTYMVEVPGINGHPPVICVTYNGNGIDCLETP